MTRQNNRLLRLNFPNGDGPSSLVANRLDAVEGLSRDFHFTIECLTDDPHIALKDVQGKMVTVELVREDDTMRYFNGYVFEFRRVRADGGEVYYDMVLLPWLAYLRLRRDNYLFHDMSIQDQSDDIFGDYAVRKSEFRINGADPIMTDACQYDESDYNYLHRRWEEKGWFYWYEHTAAGHTLILSDDSTAAAPIDGPAHIPFNRAAGTEEDDALGEWTPVRRLVPAKYALSSFNFKSPKPVKTQLPTVNEQGDVLKKEVYEYVGAYGFKDAGDADTKTRLRLEEIEASGKHFEGAGNDRYVLPGRSFTLTEHFDDGGKEFLIMEVRHSATNNYQVNVQTPSHYENRVSCIRKQIPWRPGRGYNSVEPKIYGLQTALVVGPKGEEIHTDQYGRVRVQFHWDRIGEYDEKSSAWIRVVTSWSGANFGVTAIPRIGSEVVIQFMDGNPDRPLVTGMVPNEDTMVPWTLPENKTQSGILSRSTPKGSYANANALRFEDKKGQEQLWLHAEKDQLTEVEHDEDKWVGNDRRKTVDRDETNHVKRDRTETVDRDETITVHNNRKERVDHNESISIGDNRSEDVGINETITIGANRSKTVGNNETDSIGGSWDINVARMKTETIGLASVQNVGMARMDNVGLGYDLNVGMMMATVVGKSQITHVENAISINAGDELSITVGKAKLVMKSDGTIIFNGHTFSVGTSDEQIFKADGNITLNGKKIMEN